MARDYEIKHRETRKFLKQLKDYLMFDGPIPDDYAARHLIYELDQKYPESAGFQRTIKDRTIVIQHPSNPSLNTFVHVSDTTKPPTEYSAYGTGWATMLGNLGQQQGWGTQTGWLYRRNVPEDGLIEVHPRATSLPKFSGDYEGWRNEYRQPVRKIIRLDEQLPTALPSQRGFFPEAPSGWKLTDYTQTVVAADTETGPGDKLVNLSLQAFGLHPSRGWELLETYDRYYLPNRKLPGGLAQEVITGYSYSVAKRYRELARADYDKYYTQKEIERVYEFIQQHGGRILGHNIIDFDLDRLFPGANNWSLRQSLLSQGPIDTLDLARSYRPNVTDLNKLGTLFQIVNKKSMQEMGWTQHTSSPDTTAAMFVFTKMMEDPTMGTAARSVLEKKMLSVELPRWDSSSYYGPVDKSLYMNQLSRGGNMNTESLSDQLGLLSQSMKEMAAETARAVVRAGETTTHFIEYQKELHAMTEKRRADSLTQRVVAMREADKLRAYKLQLHYGDDPAITDWLNSPETGLERKKGYAYLVHGLRTTEKAAQQREADDLRAYRLQAKYGTDPRIAAWLNQYGGADTLDAEKGYIDLQRGLAESKAIRDQQERDAEKAAQQREADDLRAYRLQAKYGTDPRIAAWLNSSLTGLDREKGYIDLTYALKESAEQAKKFGKDVDQAGDRITYSAAEVSRNLYAVVHGEQYHYEQLSNKGAEEISGATKSLHGLLPSPITNVFDRLGKSGNNSLNMWGENRRFGRTAYLDFKKTLFTALDVAGTFNPTVAAISTVGKVAATGVEGLSQFVGETKYRQITMMGEEFQRRMNLLGATVSVVTIPFKMLDSAARGLVKGFNKLKSFVFGGLGLMSDYGTPWTPLTGVGASGYASSRYADMLGGLKTGTTNSTYNTWSNAQMGLYTLGQMDTNRIIAAAMLGQFGNVYANGGNAQLQYNAFMDDIYSQLQGASGTDRQRLMWIAEQVDPNAPQLMARMSLINQELVRRNKSPLTYEQMTNPRTWGVYVNPLSDSELASNYVMGFQFQAQQEQWNNSKMRLSQVVWANGGNQLFTLANQVMDALVQAISKGDWRSAFKTLGDAVGSVVGRIKDAIAGLKSSELGATFTAMKSNIVSGIAGFFKTIGHMFIDGFWKLIDIVQSHIGDLMRTLSYIKLDIDWKNHKFEMFDLRDKIYEKNITDKNAIGAMEGLNGTLVAGVDALMTNGQSWQTVTGYASGITGEARWTNVFGTGGDIYTHNAQEAMAVNAILYHSLLDWSKGASKQDMGAMLQKMFPDLFARYEKQWRELLDLPEGLELVDTRSMASGMKNILDEGIDAGVNIVGDASQYLSDAATSLGNSAADTMARVEITLKDGNGQLLTSLTLDENNKIIRQNIISTQVASLVVQDGGTTK